MPKLPTKLSKEPLVHATFEMHLVPKQGHLTDLLPGIFHKELDGTKADEKLPLASVPRDVRQLMNPVGYEFMPLSQIPWGQKNINIGERSIALECKYPYPGWLDFKQAITKILGCIEQQEKHIESLQRYSMKYVDLLGYSKAEQEWSSIINLKIDAAGQKLHKEHLTLRVEIKRDDFIHIVQIISSAKVNITSIPNPDGLIIDIDTIKNIQMPIRELSGPQFIENLDFIHDKNKEMFFDYLKNQTLQSLGPTYE